MDPVSASQPTTHYNRVDAQTFVARDLHVEVQFTGAELGTLLSQLLDLLRSGDAQVGNGVIAARGQSLLVGPAQADALGQYVARTPATSAQVRPASRPLGRSPAPEMKTYRHLFPEIICAFQ